MGAGDIDKQSVWDEFPNPVEQPSARFLIDGAIVDDNEPNGRAR